MARMNKRSSRIKSNLYVLYFSCKITGAKRFTDGALVDMVGDTEPTMARKKKGSMVEVAVSRLVT